ncbi:hydroxyethylthiazole kinase [Halanaerobium praevalens]|uniref:Hydroxyethylthiazole kinase n=1 Tax=Halanaerobium praevalens (strain ATCC 33744 / DSM 2228 / GSL) TaxID=572479 RepID=E3DNX1_HALPG|nr:hydroxyethylthiazole kinase [Halanaerobium praevalens]ADO76595.1 hydroxyethylthiazole kinase [Halanaerobium praevalens DSM 2228]
MKANNFFESEMAANLKQLKEILQKKRPLIHQITNNVTANDCANLTLNWGALPVMAPAPAESAEMVENASALVLNLGTISKLQLKAMLKAGKRANELKIPIILDPVGVGATKFRAEAAKKILKELDIAIIKGNKAEISFLAGQSAQMSGVESIGEYKEIIASAKKLSQNLEVVVVISSKVDLIIDQNQFQKINRGHELMAQVVGTGCMLGATLGVFAAAFKELDLSLYELSQTAVYYYSLAAERAAACQKTPAKFKSEFMDQIYLLS